MTETATAAPPLGEILVAAGLLSREDLERALDLQRQSREPLGRILVALGCIRRGDLYRTLARQWNLGYIDLQAESPDPDLVGRFSLQEMIQEGFLPVRKDGARLVAAVASPPTPVLRAKIADRLGTQEVEFVVTTEWDIDQALRRTLRREVLSEATYGLFFRRPGESAYTVLTAAQYVILTALALGAVVGLYLAPRLTLIVLNCTVNLAFAIGIIFKFHVSLVGAGAERTRAVTGADLLAVRDEALPYYTILVPAYKEADVIAPLIRNLSALDYPPEKLEIFILLEEDDAQTIEAVRLANPPDNFHLVLVPNQVPRTKPKACNVGLMFARGEYLVIYDAEDRPDPDQLKKAVAAFRKGPGNLVCVQAALNYFNARENFLTRMFTLEYSYWFDYLLPGLDRLRLPIPLGGTSNHFRTEMLRGLGGWDPFNVTEDADLGVRAAARGYVVGVINSTTLEEANTEIRNWVRQRSRWIKGYMQTSLVHLRRPDRLLTQVGLKRTTGFLLLLCGTPLTFLAAPILWVLYLIWLISGTHAFDPLFPPFAFYLSLLNLLFGNLVAVYLSMLAVFKRRHYDLVIWAFLHPLYWVLHSLAAYKGLGQLFTRPFHWEKTTHGISRQLGLRPEPAAPSLE